MKWKAILFIPLILCLVIPDNKIKGQKYVPKDLERDGRTDKAADGFENFFMKASKSVPRIGRRDYDLYTKYYKDNSGLLRPYPYIPHGKVMKKYDLGLKDLQWSNLADKIEYNPEILMSPALFTHSDFEDMNNNYEQFQDKREFLKKPEANKEITEYRLQP